MIVVLFGQPGSGKTTLSGFLSGHKIDGDHIRSIFHNQDYSKEGRIKNLNRISEIAHYMSHIEDVVIVSAVFPYIESRKYLNSLNRNVKWIFLTYNKPRGKDQWHVKDFDLPSINEKVMFLDTSNKNITNCIEEINNYING